MANREFWSEDRQFGVRCAEEVLHHMLWACQQSSPNETGGILIGFYEETLDCARVTAASSAPSDSRKSGTWFRRGTYGLQSWLNGLWQRKRLFYVGEWHFHPFASPTPSRIDIQHMEEIATTPSYHCPEPLLIIIGGDISTKCTIGAYVFPKKKSFLKLFEIEGEFDPVLKSK